MRVLSSKKETIFLLGLLLLASFLRLYKFRPYMEFLDDQGRDVLVMKRILVNRDLTLLGPRTSVGNMYLGPLYYYAMTPFLALSYPDPIGPAYAMAIVGIVTVAAVYVLGKEIVGKTAAGFAGFFCAVSPTAIALSRFSWQPNPAPLVGLIMLWCTFRALKNNKWYWIGVSVCFTILSQLHYIALLSIFPSVILFIYQYLKQKQKKHARKECILIVLISCFIFILSLLPLFVFNLRHDNLILKGFSEFFVSQKEEQINMGMERINIFIRDLDGMSIRLVASLLGFPKELWSLNRIFSRIMLALLFFFSWVDFKKKSHKSFSGGMLFLWIASIMLGLDVYRNSIYDHYLGFVLPAVFLSIGFIFSKIQGLLKTNSHVITIAIVVIGVSQIPNLPYWGTVPVNSDDIHTVVQETLPFIQDQERFNIALLNNNREYMGMKYRYFYETTDKHIQSEYTYSNLDTLIIIVENGEEPLKSPIYEIQQFVQEVKNPVLEQKVVYRNSITAYIYRKQ